MKPKIVGLVILITVLSITIDAFAAQFLFTPRASVSETYTDNLFLTENNTQDDFITEVAAGFTAQLLSRTSGMELAFDPGYAFYQEYTENDTWRLPANLRVWTQPSKASRLEFTDNFLRTEDPVTQDQVAVQDGGVEETGDTTARRGREPYWRNTARLNYTQQFGEVDRFYAGASYGLLRNDSDFEEDNDNYRLNAGLDYWFTYRFGGEFVGEYTRGEFDQDSKFVGTPSSDFDNYLGTLKFRGRMTRHFSLFGQYGQAYRKFTSGLDNDYIVYAPSAGFEYSISEDTFLSLGLGYYYQDTDNEKNNSDIFLNSEISRNWNYQRGNINLAGLAGLTQNDFGAQNQDLQDLQDFFCFFKVSRRNFENPIRFQRKKQIRRMKYSTRRRPRTVKSRLAFSFQHGSFHLPYSVGRVVFGCFFWKEPKDKKICPILLILSNCS